jgi:hypothetical protein
LHHERDCDTSDGTGFELPAQGVEQCRATAHVEPGPADGVLTQHQASLEVPPFLTFVSDPTRDKFPGEAITTGQCVDNGLNIGEFVQDAIGIPVLQSLEDFVTLFKQLQA